MANETPSAPVAPGDEATPEKQGYALGVEGGEPVSPHPKGSEEDEQFRRGWQRGYDRWSAIDGRYRFGAP